MAAPSDWIVAIRFHRTHSTGDTSSLEWQIFSGDFTATGADTLNFTNLTGGPNEGVLLDAILTAAVAEPATPGDDALGLCRDRFRDAWPSQPCGAASTRLTKASERQGGYRDNSETLFAACQLLPSQSLCVGSKAIDHRLPGVLARSPVHASLQGCRTFWMSGLPSVSATMPIFRLRPCPASSSRYSFVTNAFSCANSRPRVPAHADHRDHRSQHLWQNIPAPTSALRRQASSARQVQPGKFSQASSARQVQASSALG